MAIDSISRTAAVERTRDIRAGAVENFRQQKEAGDKLIKDRQDVQAAQDNFITLASRKNGTGILLDKLA